jgi:Tfp pilus assembly protein FimT
MPLHAHSKLTHRSDIQGHSTNSHSQNVVTLLSTHMALKFKKSQSAGIGLLELMIVLAIVCVFATLAIWPFRNYLERNRLNNAVTDFESALTLTRAESIGRNRMVALRALPNVTQRPGNWSSGWGVYMDNGNGIFDNQDPQIYIQRALANNVIANNRNDRFLFLSTGRINGFTPDSNNVINIRFCSGTEEITVSINETGASSKTPIIPTSTCP